MGLESFTGIWSLNTSNPASTDDVGQGDEHIRGIKESLKRTFPRLSATANVSAGELSHLSGVESNVANRLDTLSASINAVGSNIDTLSSSLAAAISRIDSNSTTFATKIGTLSSSLSSNVSRTDTLSASLTQAISDIGELSKSVAAAHAYGALYFHETSQAFSATTSLQLLTAWSASGPSFATAPNVTAGAIIVNKAGTYEVACHLSFSASANTVYTMQLMHDAATAGFAADAAIPNNGALANMSLAGIVSATDSGSFTVQFKQNEATDNPIVFRNGQFVIKRLH